MQVKRVGLSVFILTIALFSIPAMAYVESEDEIERDLDRDAVEEERALNAAQTNPPAPSDEALEQDINDLIRD